MYPHWYILNIWDILTRIGTPNMTNLTGGTCQYSNEKREVAAGTGAQRCMVATIVKKMSEKLVAEEPCMIKLQTGRAGS